MDTEERMGLIKEVGEEIITEDDLRTLLDSKKKPIAYDGFEPSGSLHIAQGIMRAINVNKMTKAGCHFKMWVADWFAWANNKMGGDLEKIQTVGKYQIEVWKACGMEMDNVEFLWTSDAVKGEDYWKIVMDVSRNTTVKRLLRCSQIMGRTEAQAQQGSQVLYPAMQCSDIFYLEADICQLGMDQRKVNVLAREVGPKLGFWKPVIVSHHMLMGLGKPASDIKDPVEKAIEMKMSKSKPDTAIFMTDSEDDIKRKLNKAYCQEKQIEENPVLEYCRHIIFERFKQMDIERPKKFGGDLSFSDYKELEESFAKGDLHPMDLKQATAEYINKLIKPVRDHFDKNKKARELLERVKGFEVTR
ncbi:tyrosine--tRNA ligase [Candidatus Woesearchaeota archaeon]|nr:tyrosine--tRNA ligase [Candidatus Woesearchaeota archaeon]